jgi:hypothetical protein
VRTLIPVSSATSFTLIAPRPPFYIHFKVSRNVRVNAYFEKSDE